MTRRCVHAFTLVELLVVLAVAGVLAGLLLPALSSVKSAARTAACGAALRQLHLAESGYALDWRGQLMATVVKDTGGNALVLWGAPVSGSSVSDDYPMRGQFDSRRDFRRLVRCPDQTEVRPYGPDAVVTSYARNGYLGEVKPPANQTEPWHRHLRLTTLPAPERTILHADSAYTQPGPQFHYFLWTWQSPTRFGWRHRARANVSYLDGRVAPAASGQLESTQLHWNAGGAPTLLP